MTHWYPAPPPPPASRKTEVAQFDKKEFFKQGERFYKTPDGRIWNADIYDRIFTPCGGKILPRHQKSQHGRGSRTAKIPFSPNYVEFDRGIEKTCISCGEKKNLKDDFYKCPQSKDGRKNRCINCDKEHGAAKRLKYKNRNNFLL